MYLDYLKECRLIVRLLSFFLVLRNYIRLMLVLANSLDKY